MLKRIVLVWIVCFWSTFGWGQVVASGGQKLDLRGAVQHALLNSPAFDTLKKQLLISRLDESSAEAKLLPSLDLKATHGILDSSPRKSSTPWSSELSLDLTESIYDNGVSRTQLRIATLNRKQAELVHEEQKNKLSLEIATQFVNFSLNSKLFEIQEKQAKLVGRQYEKISSEFYQGMKTKKDYLRFKTQVSRNEIALLSSRSSLEKSKEELVRMIGGAPTSGAGIDFTPLSLDGIAPEISLTSLDLERHLQFRSAQFQKEVFGLNADLIARKNLPEWFLTTGVNYRSSNYLGTGQSVSQNGSTGWSALLTVQYNLFDWGTRARDKEVALLKSRIQENQVEANLLQLKSTLNQIKMNLPQIQKNFQLAKELLSLEKTNIDFIEREYRNGKVQYLDLVTGLNNLADAEIKYFTAASDLLNARYSILYHEGKLYEEIIK